MKVFNTCCKNCLLSGDRIVSSKRTKEIVKGCVASQTHFICHKASIRGEDVCCKKFFDAFGHRVQMVRIAQRLGVLEFVDQPDSEKLATFKEMSKP
jgi:hypothetical protein